jgi:hypothetical protein
MDSDTKSLRSPIAPDVAGATGFVAGCVVFFILAYNTSVWLGPPEYIGDPADIDGKDHLEHVYYLKMTVLSAVIAIVGGFMSAIFAVGIRQNGLRFSVGALLIATTLVAVALGAIAAAR